MSSQYRRAQTLLCSWHEGEIIIANYLTGRKMAADPLILQVLALMDDWTTASRVASTLDVDVSTIEWAFQELSAHSLADSYQSLDKKREAAWTTWKPWAPEAPYFHFGVRDIDYAPADVADEFLREKAKVSPPPAGVKRYPRARVVELPAGECEPALERHLLQRRTWRRFGTGNLTLGQLATLLRLTWGVQGWIQDGDKRLALKTSPSGGARHSIEAYVLVRSVSGLRPGLYHYDPDGHRLHVLRTSRVPAPGDYMPLPWADGGAAVVLMTAVFERAQWKYPYARAYRSIMFEAGHLCQTFLILATSLGLAPFCTGALADTRIERDLGIDAMTESVLYACGVGTRPAGVEWAPLPDAGRTPRLLPAKYRVRRTAPAR